MKTDTISISGMTCGGCTGKVSQALSSLPGVTNVDVSLVKKSAEITFDEALISVDRMKDAVRVAGFDSSSTAPPKGPGGCCALGP